MDKQKNKNHNIFSKIIFFIKLLEIRLRFILILLITALVVGYWDYIQNFYERYERQHQKSQSADKKDKSVSEESVYEYFCPMHTFVIRDHEDKCPICGMDLVRREKGTVESLPAGVLSRVQVSPERIMQAGVDVEPAKYRLLTKEVRSYGAIEYDETKLYKIIARFPGRIEELNVNAVGQSVKKGEQLLKIYSPKFLSAAEEFLQASRSKKRAESSSDSGADDKKRATQIYDYARQRLLLAGFTEEQIEKTENSGKADEFISLFSPLSGIVIEKDALLGEQMEEGKTLYTIADLSVVWVQIKIIESMISGINPGMSVEIISVSYPEKIFYGTVDFIYPALNSDTRTINVRVVVNNADSELKPGMSVSAVIRYPMGKYSPAGDKDEKPKKEKKTSGKEIYTCPMHPEVVSDKPGECPKCGMYLVKKTEESASADESVPSDKDKWEIGYACSMHIDKLVDKPGKCETCGCGMEMTKWKVEKVLSIPETAVIDTGTRYIVYVESQPGIYDAKEVKLGGRSGKYYRVLDGLQFNENIVTKGSFLIDAEARLNPSVEVKAHENDQSMEGESKQENISSAKHEH